MTGETNSTNPNNNVNYMTMMSDNLIITQLTNLLTQSGKSNLKQIGNIVLLLSVNEIKKMITTFVEYVKKYITHENFYYIFSMIYQYVKGICLFKHRQIEQKCEDIVEYVPINEVSVNIDVNLNFMKSLVNYLNTHNCQVTKSITDVKVINKCEKDITETWSDIQVCDISISNDLSFVFKESAIGTELISYNNVVEIENKTYKYKTFFEIIDKFFKTPEQKSFFTNVTDYIKKKSDIYKSFNNEYSLNKQYFEYGIIENIQKVCPNLDVPLSYVQFLYLLKFDFALGRNYFGYMEYEKYQSLFNILKMYDNHHVKLFGIDMTLDFNTYDANTFYYKSVGIHSSYNNKTYGGSASGSYNIYPCIKDITNDFKVLSKSSSEKSSSLKLTKSSETKSDYELQQDITSFVTTISNSIQQKTSKKINIKRIELKRTEKTIETDNPDYTEFMEHRKVIQEALSKDEISKTIDTLILSEKPPPKKLKKIEESCEIVSLPVNEVYKNFDSLYLREKDEKKLLSTLHQFKNQKDLLEQLGLPNKLCILLDGQPGTGKTSVIYTIGTYLEKDIYYVNLKNVRTNKELQQIFDYVTKHCNSGGILIFEEIDKQTEVVHKSYKPINNTTDIFEANDMTLDYFLNLLQGSLTQDNSIVIATTNNLDVIEPAFYRDGRFDVKVNMKPCDHYQIRTIFEKFLKRQIKEDVLNKIPENKYTPANIIFHVKDYLFSDDSDEVIMADFMC